ncbi:MAG: hypothetical protein ABI370_11320, partial [Gammaproteobacteria bacterium]
MITLPGYTIQEKVYDSESSTIYSGVRLNDNQVVILKLLREEYPSLEKISHFLHEHEILKKLNQEGTVAVYDLIRYKNT